jgi:hypothetical protein
MAAAGFDEVIVVDYDCPDKSSDWVSERHPDVKVVRVSDQPVFNNARARNLGASASDCSWLCFIDADVKISSRYLDWLRKNAAPGYFYRREKSANRSQEAFVRGLYGTVACQRELFQTIGGYDEVICGWGMEDIDLYIRLLSSGCEAAPVPLMQFDGYIPHDDDARVAFYIIKNKVESDRIAKLYCSAKIKLTQQIGAQDISLELRELLYDLACCARPTHLETDTASEAYPVDLSDQIVGHLSQLASGKNVVVPKTLILQTTSHKPFEKRFEKFLFSTRIVRRAKKLTRVFSGEW